MAEEVASIIKDISSDTELQSGIFIAHGVKGGKGIIYSIDFSGMHQSECKGIDTPGIGDSQYEYWEPTDMRDNECLLGRKTKYVRRKQDANCTNPDSINYLTGLIVENCSCSRSDFECDYCYKLNDNNHHQDDTCVVDPACPDFGIENAPADCTDYYYISQGYRIVPGDSCNYTTGVQLPLPKKVKCPDHYSGGAIIQVTPAWAVVFIVVVIIVGVIIGGWFYAGRNPKFYSFLAKYIPEKYLPDSLDSDRTIYSAVPTFGDDDLQADAQEIENLDDSDAAPN
jgi:hypothetical protein